MGSRNLILDTCALIWLVSGDKTLSDDARAEIDAAAAVYVSAISAWEVSLSVARGRLALPQAPLEWFHQAMEFHNLTLAHLSPAVLVHANELPWRHRDPADRFIIATAQRDGLTVVTADARFDAYEIDTLC